jgi:hypothetical protein
MVWTTDWLYSLIFAEITRLWGVAREQGTTELFGPPPRHFVIREYADADWSELVCGGPALREWLYDGTRLEERSPTDAELHIWQAQKAFYPYGVVRLHIRGDRKKIVFTYLLGPRYGRGLVFRVCDHEGRAQLEPDPEFGEWVN